jgi:hypothetical protein
MKELAMATSMSETSRPLNDESFLVTEYEHLVTTLLNSEDSGEKRVTVFLAACAAVGTAVSFVLHDQLPKANSRDAVLVAALLLLFFLGYSTYLRLIRRNLSTDRFKRALTPLREHLLAPHGDLGRRILDAYEPTRDRRRIPWDSLGKGGWLEVVMVLDAVLGGGVAAALVATGTWDGNIKVGAIVAATLWLILVLRANCLYELGTSDDAAERKAMKTLLFVSMMPWKAFKLALSSRKP